MCSRSSTDGRPVRVKICGLRTRADIAISARGGAAYAGLVFFAPSPRFVTIADARWILEDAPAGICKVALTVDAEDAEIEAILDAVSIDMLQLHGDESPERVADIRAGFGLPVMKAVGVSDETDLAALDLYAEVADQILVDARAPRESDLPGGNGVPFDWRLMRKRHWSVPWMLAGGLTSDTIAEAVRVTGAEQLDVSSGTECAPGQKDPALIEGFIRAANDVARRSA